jgi:hypothetical protein
VKAVICFAGGNALPGGGVHIHTPGSGRWQVCQCGQTAARWADPHTGQLVIAARDKSRVRGLGLSNELLLPALTGPGQAWETYRDWHDQATVAPGYVFDASRAGCWAVVYRIGTTTDTRWAADDEIADAFR